MRQLRILTGAVVLLWCVLAVTIVATSGTNGNSASTLDMDDFVPTEFNYAGWRIYNADGQSSARSSKQIPFFAGNLQQPDAALLQSRWRSLRFPRHIARGQFAPSGVEYTRFSDGTPTSGVMPENQPRMTGQVRVKQDLRYRAQPKLADPLKPTITSLFMSGNGTFSIEEKAGEEEEEEEEKEPPKEVVIVKSKPSESYSAYIWATLIVVGLLYLLAELEELEEYEMRGNSTIRRLYAPAGFGPTIRISHGLP